MSSNDSVRAVYELREAALEHGKVLADADAGPGAGRSASAQNRLLATKLALEEKTAAAIDECAENAEEAAEDAVASSNDG